MRRSLATATFEEALGAQDVSGDRHGSHHVGSTGRSGPWNERDDVFVGHLVMRPYADPLMNWLEGSVLTYSMLALLPTMCLARLGNTPRA